MLIESYLLEQFEAVARCGTLLKASEELHISQPSLSRSMKKLEDVLGVSLFIRENSKISLNETGKLAADYARRALEANQEMIERVTAFDRSLRTVSIGSCSSFPINDLMPTLQEQQLMDRRRQDKEVAAELFRRFIQESRIGKHACATVHGLHGCHIERRLARIRSRHREASHHVTEYFLHETKRSRMCARCILQRILLDLIGSHAESVQDRLVHSGGHHHAALRMKIQPEHDRHILHLFMRNG